MPSSPIAAPAGYATVNAVAYADGDGNAAFVSDIQPLPVQMKPVPTTPLAGASGAGGVIGPFVPALDRSVILTLAGTWSGTVKVVRSTDNGVTRSPLTIAGAPWGQYSANCCEPVWDESEAGAVLYLDLSLISGTVIYRLAQ